MNKKNERRMLPPTLFLLCCVTSVLIHLLLPKWPTVPAPYNLIGGVVVIFGVWILLYAHRMFVNSQTNVHTYRAPNSLVMDGAFRFSRNPMYLGFLTVLIGVAIVLGTLLPLLPAGVFFYLANTWYIPFEEAACLEAFGSEYEGYCKRVRRWI